jgi:hypothetical protein
MLKQDDFLWQVMQQDVNTELFLGKPKQYFFKIFSYAS